MGKDWFISDTHFYHNNMLNFVGTDGVSLVRPGFQDVTEMNEHMVEKWNSVVGKNDTVYHLGDFFIKKSTWQFGIIQRLNGSIVLILGNHDQAKIGNYVQYFKAIRGSMQRKTNLGRKVIFTHFPIHPVSLYGAANVHGHIHEKEIPDAHYINVSVECLDYTPISWHELADRVDAMEWPDLEQS